MSDYILTLDQDPDGIMAYYWSDDTNKIYFNLPTIARRTGYKVKAKLLNEFFLREIICIKGGCRAMNQCEDCPVERIIHRVV